MKHIAGNMRSCWTDFLTSDGEKPDRNRDQDFEIRPTDTAESLKTTMGIGLGVVIFHTRSRLRLRISTEQFRFVANSTPWWKRSIGS